MKKPILCGLVIVSGAVFILRAEQGPLDLVKSSNQEVQDLLSKHEKIDATTESELFRIIDGVTDFKTISRNTLDPFCGKLTEAQCEELGAAFQRLLRVSSIRKLGRYRADRFEYLGEDVSGTMALVRTVASYKDDRVNLDYQMKNADGKWLVINTIVDDVDTVRNYRKQFVRLFAKNNFAQVLDRLRKKIDEYENEY